MLVLGYLALTRVLQHPSAVATTPEADLPPIIEVDRFTARRERSEDGERLSVSLRLRSTLPQPIEGFVFVVARNDHASPRVWAIWPPESAGTAISAGGHFHGATPSAGQGLTVGHSWERVTAVLPHEPGQAPFDSVTIYFVSPQGQILLTRPFAI